MEESYENQNAKGTKEHWTTEEDAILVQGLLQLVDDGWKADANTFKPGYTNVLEKYLHNKIPNCTLKANPHIKSRVNHLEAQYLAIKDMFGPNASGFGWDDTRKMIVVEKEVYNQWCKSHPSAIGLYGKPFPHYDSLDVAFGKDKAIGGISESPADQALNIVREFFQSTQGSESGFNLNGDEENFESQQIPETPTYNTTKVTQPPNPINQPQCDAIAYRTEKRGVKRVKYNDDVFDSLLILLNKLGEFYAGTMENIQQLTSCFLHEKHTAERRNQIFPLLKEIEGLSVTDVAKAAMLITKDNNLCDCFFAADTCELRKEFVCVVLNNNGFP